MGMDVFANNGNYFRANIWSWRAICHVMGLADYHVPLEWCNNDGAGLADQSECDHLADCLDAFLNSSSDDIFVMPSNTMAVTKEGCFATLGTPGTQSPYTTDREYLSEFIAFLRDSDGFQIC